MTEPMTKPVTKPVTEPVTKLNKFYLTILDKNTKKLLRKCGRTCVVCDQPKSARTHAHRTHISKVFSHTHAHVRPHIAHVRVRTHLRNPWLDNMYLKPKRKLNFLKLP